MASCEKRTRQLCIRESNPPKFIQVNTQTSVNQLLEVRRGGVFVVELGFGVYITCGPKNKLELVEIPHRGKIEPPNSQRPKLGQPHITL